MRPIILAFLCAIWVTTNDSAISFADSPEAFVVCSGWHALCSDSPDCKMIGDKANCDCLRVNETHIVETEEIQDLVAKRQTLANCTQQHPCKLDEAPVCKSIREGKYEVDKVKFDWISTYSYRGWCSILERKPVPCDQNTPGYAGDVQWAICDAAPCTENPNPSDPNRPLSCQCRVKNTPFVGVSSCTGVNGGIISSFPLSGWDFQKNTYSFPMPGYEYVQSACAPLKSDPPTRPGQKPVSGTGYDAPKFYSSRHFMLKPAGSAKK